MNLYCTPANVKSQLGITDTSDDALFLTLCEMASRAVDDYCGREFFITTATRYFDGPGADSLIVDDLLSITTLAIDDDEDGVFDDESWASTDYMLLPHNVFPKTKIIEHPNGDYSFGSNTKSIEITGLWGYGDGRSATPYEATGITVTVADATTTTLTLSAEGTIGAGQTILVGTEQMFVTAVTSDESKGATVERGANGTTAAAQDGAASYVYLYPHPITQTAIEIVKEFYNLRKKAGMDSEMIGDYQWRRASKSVFDLFYRIIGPYRRFAL